jgi:hypothetical protein
MITGIMMPMNIMGTIMHHQHSRIDMIHSALRLLR